MRGTTNIAAARSTTTWNLSRTRFNRLDSTADSDGEMRRFYGEPFRLGGKLRDLLFDPRRYEKGWPKPKPLQSESNLPLSVRLRAGGFN